MKIKQCELITKFIITAYSLTAIIGGTVLGFLSLGLSGLLVGFSGGILLSYCLHRSLRWFQRS